jgi:hypothetical protein
MEHDQLPTDTAFAPLSSESNSSHAATSPPHAYVPAREIRKARRKEKRHLHQVERTRIRERLHDGLRDPEIFLDLEDHAKNTRRLQAGSAAARRVLLEVQRRRLKSELANTRDLDTFIQKTSRSRTLYALVGLAFFRHVWRSDAFRDDHRYKLAIARAMEEPGLAKSIQRKWDAFDREFPDPSLTREW